MIVSARQVGLSKAFGVDRDETIGRCGLSKTNGRLIAMLELQGNLPFHLAWLSPRPCCSTPYGYRNPLDVSSPRRMSTAEFSPAHAAVDVARSNLSRIGWKRPRPQPTNPATSSRRNCKCCTTRGCTAKWKNGWGKTDNPPRFAVSGVPAQLSPRRCKDFRKPVSWPTGPRTCSNIERQTLLHSGAVTRATAAGLTKSVIILSRMLTPSETGGNSTERSSKDSVRDRWLRWQHRDRGQGSSEIPAVVGIGDSSR